jgi:hypothetical protein
MSDDILVWLRVGVQVVVSGFWLGWHRWAIDTW